MTPILISLALVVVIVTCAFTGGKVDPFTYLSP